MLDFEVPPPISPSVSSASPVSATPSRFERPSQLPSPPAAGPPPASRAPPSPPQHDDLDPSPCYSPLSPKPPPSPPLGPRVDCAVERERIARAREKLRKEKEQKEKEEKERKEKEEKEERERKGKGRSSPAATDAASAANEASSSSNISTHNVDGIALRSTLRLLMLQREKAKRDIVALEEMREYALKEPVEFVEWIQQQKRSGRTSPSSATAKAPGKAGYLANKEIPKPQEIYRCPSIEWSQYCILPGPLEHLHEKQRRRPSPSRPVGASAAGVPQNMQTGGIIGIPPMEFTDTIGGDASGIQGRMRLFDGIGQRGSVVGR